MFEFIFLLKAIAAVLITNSHYENIWPISALAAGGALGNSIFFMVSGFCLSSTKVHFWEWYKKRVLRIYPQIFIVTTVALLIGCYSVTSTFDILRLYIFPTAYWFVGAIMVFYPLLYLIVKYVNEAKWPVVFGALLCIYLLIYIFVLDTTHWVVENNIPFKSIFYFSIMLAGYKLRTLINSESNKIYKHKLQYLVGSGIGFLGFFGIKYICSLNEQLMQLQGLQHICLFVFTTSFILLIYCYEQEITQISKKKSWSVVRIVASMTLEIYLVQVPIVAYAKYIVFPYSLVLITGLILLCAFAVSRVSKLVTGLLLKGKYDEITY